MITRVSNYFWYRPMVSRRLLVLSTFAGFCLPLSAAEPSYLELKTPFPNADRTLIKIFSYDCPFCYRYDKTIDPWLRETVCKDANLQFVPVFLESRATYGSTAALFLALCQAEDRKNGHDITDSQSLFARAKDALYFAYLKKKERWQGGEKDFIQTLSEATGISADIFARRRSDPDVLAIRTAWAPSKEAGSIQGIPAYVVNGKYLILNKAVRSKSVLADLISELSAKS